MADDIFKTALYGESESSPFLPDYMDFLASYDDIARKYQSKAAELQQDYLDATKEASQPRQKTWGETFSQALLSFGTPLIGKAIGGSQLGGQAAQLGAAGAKQLEASLDQDYQAQQKAAALRAMEAKQGADLYERAAIELPVKKMGVQSQMAVNRTQMEDSFRKQQLLQQQEAGNRLAQIQAMKGGSSGNPGVEGGVQQLAQQYRLKTGQEATPEMTEMWRADLGRDLRSMDMHRRMTDSISAGAQLRTPELEPQEGAVPSPQQKVRAIDATTSVRMVDDALSELKAAIQSGDITAIRNASAASLQAMNSSKVQQTMGAAFTSFEGNILLSQLAPSLAAITTVEDLQRVIAASGIDPIKSIDMTMARVNRQGDIVLGENGYKPRFSIQQDPKQALIQKMIQDGIAAGIAKYEGR